jgi:hypothetical protein
MNTEENLTAPPIEDNMSLEEDVQINEVPEEEPMPSVNIQPMNEAPVNVFSSSNTNTKTTTMFANRMEDNGTMNRVKVNSVPEEEILGEKVDTYKDDIRFLDSVLLPVMKKYFPSDANLNGDSNILQNVLKHDAIVVVRVNKMLDEVDGSISKEEFVEKVEDYLDEMYVDKDDIEDTLEITLKYVCGMKANLENYIEYDFFCANVAGYNEFVAEMKKHRVVTATNRHMFYNELHGYLHKQVFENYNFASAVYDFDTKMKEFVETQKQNTKKNKNNTNMNRNNKNVNNNNNSMNVNNNNNNSMNLNNNNNNSMNVNNNNNNSMNLNNNNNNSMNLNNNNNNSMNVNNNNNNSMNVNNNNNNSMNVNNNNNNSMNVNNNNNNNMNVNNNNNNNNNNNKKSMFNNDDIEIEIEGPLEDENVNMNTNNNYTRKNTNRDSNTFTRRAN